LNVETQEADCREACEAEGWRVIEPSYIDNDITAADPDKPRPAYLRLMEDIARDKVDVVVVYKEDRLHRQPIELEQFVAGAKSAGMTKLYSVKSGFTDLSDSAALMILRIKGDVAAHEVDQLRDRVVRKKRAQAEAGEWAGGRRPYGYRAVDGKLVIDKAEAATIRKLAKRVIEGTPLMTLARELNEDGVKATYVDKWSAEALRDMLLRPSVAGIRQYRGEEIGKAQWDPILPEDQWRQVVSILTDPARKTPRLSRNYPLKGLLKCGVCGRDLKAASRQTKRQSGGSKRWYACLKKAGGCGSIWIVADILEQYVFRLLLPLLDSPDVRGAIAEHESVTNEEIAVLVAEKTKNSHKIEDYGDLFDADQIDAGTYGRRTKKLRDRTEAIEAQIASMRSHSALDRLGGEVQAQWDSMTPEDRTLLLSTVIEEIVITRSTKPKGYNRLDPSRVNFKFLKHTITGLRAAIAHNLSHMPLRTVDPDQAADDMWDEYVDGYLEDRPPSKHDGIDPERDLGLEVEGGA